MNKSNISIEEFLIGKIAEVRYNPPKKSKILKEPYTIQYTIMSLYNNDKFLLRYFNDTEIEVSLSNLITKIKMFPDLNKELLNELINLFPEYII